MRKAPRIYLDHAATTPMLPEVNVAMKPWLHSEFGNPSSLYAEGRSARAAIDASRETLSAALGCEFGEVIFTSSGTEAANLAIIGSALANQDERRNRILFSAAEHHCVLNTQPLLERLGYRVEFIPVERYSQPNLSHLENALGPDVLLVSVMSANNELGTILSEGPDSVAAIAHEHGAVYFCDAVQSLSEGVKVGEADLIAVAAHKINGPKGVGALYIRAGTKVKPLNIGGGQEREQRAGTENVAGIVGFAEAVRQYQTRFAEFHEAKRLSRDAFTKRLSEIGIEGLVLMDVGDKSAVLPGHCHLRVEGVPAEAMLIVLDRLGVSASSGAACSSGSLEPSHVLLACGYTEAQAKEGLRFSFGITNTVEDGLRAAEIVSQASEQIKSRGVPLR